MAQEDYLKDSPFGKATGALLSRKDDLEDKELLKLLALSFGESLLGNLQVKQKNDTVEVTNDIKENYADIFTNNEAIYNADITKKNRLEYQLYKDDPDAYLTSQEIKLFNADKNIQAENISYNDIGGLDPDSKKQALQVAANYRTEAEERIKKLGLNPAVYIPSFSQFNQLAQNEAKAALAEVQDDPTRQGLVRAGLNKVFGYGSDAKALLALNLEKAKELRMAQDNKVSPRETASAKEELDTSILFDDNKTAEKVIQSQNNDYFDYVTTEEKLKLERDNFITKVNKAGYEYTLEDMHKSAELGVQLPGLSGFNNVLVEQRPTLVSAFKKAREAIKNNQHPLEALDGAEANIYAIAIGTTVDEYKGKQITLEYNQLRLDKAKNPDVLNIDAKQAATIFNKTNPQREVVESRVADILLTQGRVGADIQDIIDNKMYGTEGEAFISNIMLTQQVLLSQTERYSGPTAYTNSLDDAINMQLRGLYLPAGTTEGFIGRTLKGPFNNVYRHEMVDPRHFRLIEEDITSNEMAQELVNALNSKNYMRSLKMMDNETGESITLAPDTAGKSFIEKNKTATYEFFVEQLIADDPSSLVWNYRELN